MPHEIPYKFLEEFELLKNRISRETSKSISLSSEETSPEDVLQRAREQFPMTVLKRFPNGFEGDVLD